MAATRDMPAPLIEKVEALSGYRHLFPPGDPRATRNPVAWSHLRILVGGQGHSVLSRACDSGLDYSERTNKFVHHIILGPGELPAAGPAWLLGQPGFMETAWQGEPRQLPVGRTPPNGQAPPAICRAWERAVGDAGWAGILAEAFLADAERTAYLLFEPGMDLLPLIAEALALLPVEQRWEVSFSTYLSSLPVGTSCAWRGVPRGSPEAAAAQRHRRNLVLDLGTAPGRAFGGPLVDLARTGKAVVPPVAPALPGYRVREVEAVAVPRPSSPGPVTVERKSAAVSLPPELAVPQAGLSWRSFGLGAGSGIMLSFGVVAALLVLAPDLVSRPMASVEAPRPVGPAPTATGPARPAPTEIVAAVPDPGQVCDLAQQQALREARADPAVRKEAIKQLKENAEVHQEAIKQLKENADIRDEATEQVKKHKDIKDAALQALMRDDALLQKAEKLLVADREFQAKVADQRGGEILRMALRQFQDDPAFLGTMVGNRFKEQLAHLQTLKQVDDWDIAAPAPRKHNLRQLKGLKDAAGPFRLHITDKDHDFGKNAAGVGYKLTCQASQEDQSWEIGLEEKIGSDKPNRYLIGEFSVKDAELSFTRKPAPRKEPDEARLAFSYLQDQFIEVIDKDGMARSTIALRHLDVPAKRDLAKRDLAELARALCDQLEYKVAVKDPAKGTSASRWPPLQLGPVFLRITMPDKGKKGEPVFEFIDDAILVFMDVGDPQGKEGHRVNVCEVKFDKK